MQSEDSDSGFVSELKEVHEIVQPEPYLMMEMATIDSGWTEWYTYESGRFSETVVYRRENPFLLHGSLGLSYLIIYVGLKRLAGMALPGPIDALSSEITASTIIGYVPIVASLFIAAWFLAGIWSRRNTREEEQFNRDTMYPPKEYWEEATGR